MYVIFIESWPWIKYLGKIRPMFKYSELKEKHVDSSHIQRRKIIIDEMDKLFSLGKDCLNCEGHCCTFTYNSMQVTPIEAVDTYVYLRENNLITDQLIKKLEECITSYRLDIEFNMGGRREFRKNYTCPFFNNGPKGCGISRKYKPYGCLGFNALRKGVSEPGSCTSNVELLEKRSLLSLEDKINQELKEGLNLYWDKKSFPVAVLQLIKLYTE